MISSAIFPVLAFMGMKYMHFAYISVVFRIFYVAADNPYIVVIKEFNA